MGELGVAAGQGHHPASCSCGKLHQQAPHPAGRSSDRDHVAGSDAGCPGQADRGAAVGEQGGRHAGVQRVGNPVQLVDVGECQRRVGLAPPHEIVLLYLDDHGPVRQTALVHYLGRDRSTVTATLQAMERHGLITREHAADDNRAMIVRLTSQGEQAVPAARAAWAQLERETVGGLTAAQQRSLVKLLGLVRDELHRTLTENTR